MKIYRITRGCHWGAKMWETTFEGSESECIKKALNEMDSYGQCLCGYADHFDDEDHHQYPKFDHDGKQVSGATVTTFRDAIAWFRYDTHSLKVEEFE